MGSRPEAARFASRVAQLWAVGALVILGFSFAVRVPFPFVLEWQESAMLEHALRVRAGQGLYVEPTPTFAPFPYPPLFHWLGAAVISVLGASLPALRLVSVLSTVALLACVYAIARRRGGAAGGRIAAGFLAATYTWAGQWLDVARVDTLALALSGGALLCATTPASLAGRWRTAAAGGGLAGLAVLAKQTSLGLAVALAVGLALRRSSRPSAVAFAAGCAVVLVPIVVWLDTTSSGWFRFTTIDVLAGSPWHRPAILGFWLELLFVLVPIAALVLAGRGDEEDATPEHPVAAVALVALVLTAWVGRAHEGAFLNTLLPAALAGALVAGPLAVRAGRVRPRATMAIVSAAFLALLFVPRRGALPSELDRERAEEVAARIAAVEGEVWQPHGAIDPARPGGVHAMAINDLLKSGEGEVAQSFVDALSRALDEKRFAAIVFAVDPEEWADLTALARNYRKAERLDIVPERVVDPSGVRPAFITPTGAPHGPRWMLRPR